MSALAKWDVGMNPEQLEAVHHDEGPLALMAVAGCGKTRVLVHRIARLIGERKASAENILAVTFSKKAQEEMETRLKALGVRRARVATWHSLALQILKEDATEWSAWTTDDRNQDKVLLKQVVGFKGMDWKDADVTALMQYIGVCKSRLALPDQAEAEDEAVDRFGRDGARAVEAYRRLQAELEQRALLTFDDMLVNVHKHLSRDEEVQRRWAGRWSYVLQDESQDANLAQVAIGHMLAQYHRNYMLVGDPAQAIYGFRGTTPEYLMAFADQWGAKVVHMNRNYRSGRRIIAAANRAIAPAKVRLPVEMVAERDHEGEVRILASQNLDDEAQNFAKLCAAHKSQDGGSYSDVCALFRTNAQSRALEEALLKERIPYVVVGGISFYERKEVKDLLGYLRTAAGRGDLDAVRRSLNAPFRYLGTAFVERVLAAAEAEGEVTDWAALLDSVGQQAGLQARQRASAGTWAALIRGLREQDAKRVAPAEMLHDLVQRTQYIKWLEKEEGQESIETSGAANVRELQRVSQAFPTLDAFLTYVDETIEAARRQRRDGQAGGERVLLMSIHRSKGLEWPIVFLGGCNDGILPHARGDVEEERRLFYVGVTRARDSLVLSYVRELATRSGIKQAAPSPFLDGLLGE